MGSGFEVLDNVSNTFDSTQKDSISKRLIYVGKTYHLQCIFTFEQPITVVAVMLLEVFNSSHVLIARPPSMKSFGTSVAFVLNVRMAHSVHVMIGSLLGGEVLVAYFASKWRCPVRHFVHMLIRGVLAKGHILTSFAFISRGPMVECVHVLNSGFLAAEYAITCLTLIVVVPPGVCLKDTCARLDRECAQEWE